MDAILRDDEVRHRAQRQWAWRIYGGLAILVASCAVGSVLFMEYAVFFLVAGSVAFVLLVAPMFGRSP